MPHIIYKSWNGAGALLLVREKATYENRKANKPFIRKKVGKK